MPHLDPKFPVVNPHPTVSDAIGSCRVADYFTLAGITSASWSYGFIMGKPYRFATAGTAASIGFTFGTMVILQNTRGRFLGFKENSKEVAKYGLAADKYQPKKFIQADPRFPIAMDGVRTVQKEFDWDNYS